MRELLRNKTLRLSWLIIFLMTGALLFFSCEESTGPGQTTPPSSRKLLIYSDKNSIPANGGSAQILVKVYAENDTTNVISGVKVVFAANQAGTQLAITVQNDLADANGY
ncbi:MAG: hypothetical protein HOC71_14070, partial [Candidatus Latescibacteria bacterium]|nr:hypothetical protein [Candidatus Latescibacterota bacterium]